MPSAAEKCRELSGNFTLSGEWSPCFLLSRLPSNLPESRLSVRSVYTRLAIHTARVEDRDSFRVEIGIELGLGLGLVIGLVIV